MALEQKGYVAMNYAQPDGASGVLSVLLWLILVVLPGMRLLSLVWLVGAARSSSVSHLWFSALGGRGLRQESRKVS